MINTPAYIFNLDILQERVDRIKSLVPDIELTFSIKANPFLVPYIIDMVRHVEVCSPGELAICKADNIPASKNRSNKFRRSFLFIFVLAIGKNLISF